MTHSTNQLATSNHLGNLELELTPEQVELLCISVYEKQQELTEILSTMNRTMDDPLRKFTEESEALLLDLFGTFERFLED